MDMNMVNMNTQLAATTSLQFGVEIELLLEGRKKAFSSWKALASDVSKRLSSVGIANHVHDDAKGLATYEAWAIVREVTVPNQPAKGLWGIELVSPIYSSVGWSWARVDIDLLFATLEKSYKLRPSANCSTHIHVSGTPAPLCTMALTQLVQAALYFESALDQLVPAERRDSSAYWCQSLRASPGLRGRSLGTCLDLLAASLSSWYEETQVLQSQEEAGAGGGISGPPPPRHRGRGRVNALDERPDTRVVRTLVETVNLFPAASAYGKAHGKKKDFVRGKVYKWDFSGMLPPSFSSSSSAAGGPRGTVEFRQAPGSRSAEDAQGWISVVLGLVACVTTSSGWTVPYLEPLAGKRGGSLDELWAVLETGAAILGWDVVGAATQVFAKRTA